jgi:hypothetical protein
MTADRQDSDDAMTRLLERAAAGVGEPRWNAGALARKARRTRATRRATAAAAAAIVLGVGASVSTVLLADRTGDRFGYLASGLDRPPQPIGDFRPKEPGRGCGQQHPVGDAASEVTERAAVGGPFNAVTLPPDIDVTVFVVRVQQSRHTFGGGLEVVLGAKTDALAYLETHQFDGEITLLDGAGRVLAGYPAGHGINASAAFAQLQPRTARVLGVYGLWACDLSLGIPDGAKYVRIAPQTQSTIHGVLTIP